MSANHDDDESGVTPTTTDVSRRRFARAGIATPVVLSSLVSKPVLGAAPYHCTVSGQVSGNISPRADDGMTCVIGSSRGTWLTSTAWPNHIVRGTLPNAACSFSDGLVAGTRFNGYQKPGTVALSNRFFNASASGACNVTTTSNSDPASWSTMLQVLNTTATSEPFVLGRATVVSLLNSYQFAPNYPITDASIIAMFNATIAGGTYAVNTSVSWSRTQVINYLQSLYPPG